MISPSVRYLKTSFIVLKTKSRVDIDQQHGENNIVAFLKKYRIFCGDNFNYVTIVRIVTTTMAIVAVASGIVITTNHVC